MLPCRSRVCLENSDWRDSLGVHCSAASTSNDEVVLNQAAVFTGGRITDTLGAFVRATCVDNTGNAAWDTADLRYADQGKIWGHDVIWGASLINDPTSQDVWNTIATWRFPYYVLFRVAAGAAR